MTDEVGPGALVGRQIAGYQVLALLGAGGMGEVYRARDTRLGRDVALKVLQQHRAADPAQQARFQREAQAASALNHPNILAVYDVGVEDGIAFIVTELIDGTSLRDLLERGPMPVKKLLDLATQIAEGLATAHEAGIVHRDLKPDNLMVTSDGRAKILDFGLATGPLPTAPPEAGAVPVTRTETGLLQGTVPYMSPEQARGETGDFRSDQFSFGLMLYEMTTGTRAFQRETPVQTLSAIIADEAPLISNLNSRAPVPLHWLIERCLAKDPLHRYAATRDLAQDLRTLRTRLVDATTLAASVPHAAQRRSTLGILLLVAATIATALVGLDVWLRLRPRDFTPTGMFPIPPPKGTTFSLSSAFMTVSPNGQSLAFVASSPEGKTTLWVRQFGSVAPHQLLGTEDAGQPYWSRDSRFIAFHAGRITKKIDVSHEVVETLDDAVGSGTWNAQNIIVGPRPGEGLYAIAASAGGGLGKPVTTLDPSKSETGHTWPYFLPDGHHFLFLAASNKPEYDGLLYVGSLESMERKPLLDTPVDSNVAYAAAGYLLYMRGTTLYAVRFDADSLQVTGPQLFVADHVWRTAGTRRGAFSVSHAGAVLAYQTVGETQLTWFDRGGHPMGTIGPPGLYGNPALSPDDKWVAVNRYDLATGANDIWVIDAAKGNASRFTRDTTEESKPLWSPDGKRVVYRSNRRTLPAEPAEPGFYSKALKGLGPDELLMSGVGGFASPLGWTLDGSLLYEAPGAQLGMDLWTLPLTGNRKAVAFLNSVSSEEQGQLSPNKRWIAYVSNESTRAEVYVRPFPSGDGRWQITTQGGIEPRWSANGTELFYLAPDHYLMSVKIEIKTPQTLVPGVPKQLFETRMSALTDRGYTRNQYVVMKDGRFLINQPESPTPITVVLDWTALLKR